MADLGGFNVTSPQEILGQLAAQRQKVMVAGTVQQQRNQNIETALDTVFGNPQVAQAKRIQQRIAAAEQSVVPVEGEDDLTREMRRLSAIRDSVADLSPETSSQITTQLLKLGQMRMERSKLIAEENRAVEDQNMERELHPLALAAKQQEIDANAAKGQNYWRERNGQIERQNVAELDSLDRKRLRMEGWIEGSGPNTEAEASSALGLNKPVVTDLQTAMLDADAQLDGLASIMQKYDPSFSTIGSQVANWGRGTVEQLGLKLPAGEAAKLQQYSEWRRNSVDAFNRYIKYLTGAAMSNKEADRIQKGFPDVEKDGPAVYMSKLREVARQTLAVRKRAQFALQNGLQARGEQWDGITLPSVSDSEVDDFMAQQGFGPAPATRQQSVIDRFRSK